MPPKRAATEAGLTTGGAAKRQAVGPKADAKKTAAAEKKAAAAEKKAAAAEKKAVAAEKKKAAAAAKKSTVAKSKAPATPKTPKTTKATKSKKPPPVVEPETETEDVEMVEAPKTPASKKNKKTPAEELETEEEPALIMDIKQIPKSKTVQKSKAAPASASKVAKSVAPKSKAPKAVAKKTVAPAPEAEEQDVEMSDNAEIPEEIEEDQADDISELSVQELESPADVKRKVNQDAIEKGWKLEREIAYMESGATTPQQASDRMKDVMAGKEPRGHFAPAETEDALKGTGKGRNKGKGKANETVKIRPPTDSGEEVDSDGFVYVDSEKESDTRSSDFESIEGEAVEDDDEVGEVMNIGDSDDAGVQSLDDEDEEVTPKAKKGNGKQAEQTPAKNTPKKGKGKATNLKSTVQEDEEESEGSGTETEATTALRTVQQRGRHTAWSAEHIENNGQQRGKVWVYNWNGLPKDVFPAGVTDRAVPAIASIDDVALEPLVDIEEKNQTEVQYIHKKHYDALWKSVLEPKNSGLFAGYVPEPTEGLQTSHWDHAAKKLSNDHKDILALHDDFAKRATVTIVLDPRPFRGDNDAPNA